MRCHDNGSFYGVTVTASEVEAFKENFPCSGLPDSSIYFQFCKRTGDLVDIEPGNIDGPGLSALSEDAQAYGKKRLGLE